MEEIFIRAQIAPVTSRMLENVTDNSRHSFEIRRRTMQVEPRCLCRVILKCLVQEGPAFAWDILCIDLLTHCWVSGRVTHTVFVR